MRIRGGSLRTTAVAVVISVTCLVALGACSQGSNSDSASDAGGAAAEGEANQDAISGGGDSGVAQRDAASVPTDEGYDGSGSLDVEPAGSNQSQLVVGSSLIKTGAVSLESGDIGRELTRIYSIVASTGGEISKEDTTTDRDGEEIRSMLVLRVPVDEFDSTLNEISQLGTLVTKARNSRDVTTEVIDIASRVESAQESITTLRKLFSRATALGDIIRLESELAQREANLESLQAQQRALADKTTMSTLTVTIDQPSKPEPQTTSDDDEAGGFVSGIKQGWDAMKTAVLAVGHGLGLVLPLGTLILLAAAVVFWGVRRWAPPRQRPVTEDGSSLQ